MGKTKLQQGKENNSSFKEMKDSFDLGAVGNDTNSSKEFEPDIDIASRLNGISSKKLEQDLYILPENDFIMIGCGEDEMKKVRELNEALGKLPLNTAEESTEQTRQERRTIQEQLYNIFLGAAEKNVRSWEYANSSLPGWLRSTGNISSLDQTLRVYGDGLSVVDKVRLLKQRQVTMKAKQLAREQANGRHSERFAVVSDNDKSAQLTGIHQNAYQSGGNGCWSATTELLLKSRGIDNVDQFDVRNYRPDYKGGEIRGLFAEKNELHTEAYNNMTADKSNNVMERGDAFLSLAPGSMLQGLQITGYSNEIRKMGISREEYLRRTKEVVGSHILHAIKEDRSPVSFIAGGHYITITGIDDKGIVTYKDSQRKSDGLGPDADRKISLENLVKKVVSPASYQIRMEWASDIKLSKDGKKLYGVPSTYLSVGKGGEVLSPSQRSTGANSTNTFQNKSGMYISRMNGSEGPDENANLENNMKNGGVDMMQIVYIPKKLNMRVLQRQAAERSPEEEERLKDMSKSFYGVEYKDREPLHTQETLDETYGEIEKAYNRGVTDKQRLDAVHLTVIAGNVKEPLAQPADSNSRKYDNYINRLCREAATAKNMFASEKRAVIAAAVNAAMMKADGIPFNEKKIKALSVRLANNTAIQGLEFKETNDILSNPNKIAIFDALQKDISGSMYGVEPEYRENYLKEMKLLAENMLTKEGRTDKYEALYDAVKEASEIDLHAEDAGKRIADANRKLMNKLEIYTEGKEKVRVSTGGQDRFNNAMDAASILATFAPACGKIKIDSMVGKINKARGAKNISNPDFVVMRNFGGARAKKRTDEINASKNKNKVVENAVKTK